MSARFDASLCRSSSVSAAAAASAGAHANRPTFTLPPLVFAAARAADATSARSSSHAASASVAGQPSVQDVARAASPPAWGGYIASADARHRTGESGAAPTGAPGALSGLRTVCTPYPRIYPAAHTPAHTPAHYYRPAAAAATEDVRHVRREHTLGLVPLCMDRAGPVGTRGGGTTTTCT